MKIAALCLRNVNLRAGEFCVCDIALSVAAGEYFVLMGLTGSGKSMLLKSICGLMRVRSGRILIHGEDVTNLEPARRKVGYVPQHSDLFPHLRVIDNITFGLQVRGQGRILARECVAEIVATLGLDHLVERSTVHLSGGERQKVALGRALAVKPEILLLDEPVSALDEPTRFEMCRVLKTIHNEFHIATMHICHSADEARSVADRIGVMQQGRLIAQGTPKELEQMENPVFRVRMRNGA